MSVPFAEFMHAGIRLLGTSVAGEETCIVAPELDLSFDFGRAPREVVHVNHVFLSHGHMDHAAGAAYYFSQRLFIDNQPGTVYLPAHLADPIRRLLEVWGEIDGNPPPANIVIVDAGQDVSIRRDLIVRPFRVNHPSRGRDRSVLHALGFAAIDVRKKLKPEFNGLNGAQIVELKNKGVEIEHRVEVPLVAYCGDTAPGEFLDLEYVRTARILLLECTFIDPEHRDRAWAGKHMHVDYLRDIVPKLANERILLTHLTRRTLLSDAREAVLKMVGEQEAERISFLAEHRRRSRKRRDDVEDAAG